MYPQKVRYGKQMGFVFLLQMNGGTRGRFCTLCPEKEGKGWSEQRWRTTDISNRKIVDPDQLDLEQWRNLDPYDCGQIRHFLNQPPSKP